MEVLTIIAGFYLMVIALYLLFKLIELHFTYAIDESKYRKALQEYDEHVRTTKETTIYIPSEPKPRR